MVRFGLAEGVKWRLPTKGTVGSAKPLPPGVCSNKRTENNKIVSKINNEWFKKCNKHTFVSQPTERKGQEIIESGQSFLVWFPIWKKSNPKYMYIKRFIHKYKASFSFWHNVWNRINVLAWCFTITLIQSECIVPSNVCCIGKLTKQPTQAVNNINHK